jgi:putative Ca2+/H+ antiporter (TMEM165/GDT1 family)
VTERGELALYLVAGVVYVVLGLAVPNLLLSWVEGAAFLLLAVWLIPAFVRRLR